MLYFNTNFNNGSILSANKSETVNKNIEVLKLSESINKSKLNDNQFWISIFDVNEYVVYVYIDFIDYSRSFISFLRFDFDVPSYIEVLKKQYRITDVETEHILKVHKYLNFLSISEHLGVTKFVVE